MKDALWRLSGVICGKWLDVSLNKNEKKTASQIQDFAHVRELWQKKHYAFKNKSFPPLHLCFCSLDLRI